MPLPLLKPADLNQEQRAVYDSIREVTDQASTNFMFMKKEGELIGPFKAMLHFPQFGAAAWAMNKTTYDPTRLVQEDIRLARDVPVIPKRLTFGE
jgi:hypothetical protein